MTEYTLDKYDFKKYLLEELPDSRQEELIFWKKTIPIPVDLIYDLFEKRGILLAKYLDHIGSAFLFAYINKAKGNDWGELLSHQPNLENTKIASTLTEEFRTYMPESGVSNLLSELAELLLLENYQPHEESFKEAICHEGRKYKRLWLPKAVREKINIVFPELLDHIGLGNWDMFSNVVTDELKIYRMGFADAFKTLFNKLIEFILKHSASAKKGFANASGFKISQDPVPSPSEIEIVYGNVSDGGIWEPVYKNAKTSFVLNTLHPFCDHLRKQGGAAEQILAKMIAVMAEKENEIIRQGDKKLIEIFRQDISRELRIRLENEN